MADQLTLRLLTPQREICDEPAAQVTAEGSLGQFSVLPDHTTFLTSLEPGPLTLRLPGGGERTIAVKGGYAEVRDDVVTVLADDAMPVERIDPARAQADRERAAKALEELSFTDPEHERMRRELRWAEAQIALARG
jgi:F-type H+-transporting ATPase subunit epsilon